MSGDPKDPHSMGDVVEGLEELAEEEDAVRIADVLDKFGNRSFAPVMMFIALIELTPAGAIPGVPSFLALSISLVAVQLLFGRDHIWVPDWIERRSVPSAKLKKAMTKLETVADKVDHVAHSRLEFLARGVGLRIAAAIIIVLCLTVPPFEVLPFASTGPMLAIDVICLAIMVRDGFAMLIAWTIAAAAMIAIGYFYLASGVTGG